MSCLETNTEAALCYRHSAYAKVVTGILVGDLTFCVMFMVQLFCIAFEIRGYCNILQNKKIVCSQKLFRLFPGIAEQMYQISLIVLIIELLIVWGSKRLKANSPVY